MRISNSKIWTVMKITTAGFILLLLAICWQFSNKSYQMISWGKMNPEFQKQLLPSFQHTTNRYSTGKLHRASTSEHIHESEHNGSYSIDGSKLCFMGIYCFSYSITPTDICPRRPKENIKLFVFVFSLPDNHQRRKLIRKTWGNTTLFESDIRLVFLLAHTKKVPNQMHALRLESDKYNDIVMSNFEDSFYNLTLKGLTGLHIAMHLCPSARFVMKTDDDMLINMFSLLKKLSTMIKQGNYSKVIMGYVWTKGEVFRKGAYAIRKEVYKPDLWPTFCSGSAIIFSNDTVSLLFSLAMADRRKHFIHLDDPYITGVLAAQTDIKHIYFNGAYMLFDEGLKTARRPGMKKKQWQRYVVDHIFWHLHDKDYIGKKNKEIEHIALWKEMSRFARNLVK